MKGEDQACLARLLSAFTDPTADDEARAAVVNDHTLSDRELERALRRLGASHRRCALAMCDRPAVLAAWASSGTPDERALIAFNPYTPSGVLRRLAEDEDPRVRMQIPFNGNADPDVLARLLLDDAPEVQDAIEVAFDSDEGRHLRNGARSAALDRPDEFG